MSKKVKKSHITVIALIAVLVGIYSAFRFSPYPELNAILNQPYSTRFYDCEGILLQVIPLKSEDGLRREWTSIEEIPDEVKKYFIASEDRHFYRHSGVDFTAIAGAIFQNTSSGRVVRGASTITMQLVRIMQKDSIKPRTFSTKICDVFNAWRLESRLSKNKILELYLNNVPFGMNMEGVTTAARTIFGKPLEELTSEEICCLAIIPRYPSLNNPLMNSEQSARKAEILYEAVNKEKVQMDFSNLTKFEYPKEMPHYIEYLTSLYESKNIPFPPEIRLSASLRLHNEAENLVNIALESAQNSRISNAAVLILDNENNSVLTWLGNSDWYDYEHSGQVDGVLVNNQPGSSMKPFLYALALDSQEDIEMCEQTFYPNTVLPDVPMEFGESNVYIPANFNNRFNGPVRLRVALASSLNIPAVYILNQIGIPSYMEMLKKLNFDSLTKGEAGIQADLGLALGAGEVSLKELVPAFSIFVRDGKYIPLTYSQQSPSEPVQIIQPDTARIITSFLSDKASRALGFGYTQTYETQYPSIFKTGTSNQYQNIIALGATKKWTVGVWMGNFSGETVIGKTGSSLPAYVAKNLLDYLMSEVTDYEDLNFPEPQDYELQPVCALSGLHPGPGCTSTVYEYVKKEQVLSSCYWHDSNGSVNYPSEYQQWFHMANHSGRLNYNDSPLKLMSPQNNSVFYYDANLQKKQAISCQFTGGFENEMDIYYDGRFYKKLLRPFVVSLPVEKGNHFVEGCCGKDKVSFSYEVR